MKQADFIYEILPKLGEYGFSTRPRDGCAQVEARVRSLAGSFQWRSAFSSGHQALAVAVDTGDPLLVASITQDDGDPHCRTSLRLQVWIADSWDAACVIVSGIWPEASLPVSETEFLEQARQFDGVGGRGKRLVVGPHGTFTAVNFATAIGAARAISDPPATGGARVARQRNRSTAGRPVKWLAALTSLLCLLLGGTSYWLFSKKAEVEQHAANLVRMRDELDKQWADASGTTNPDGIRDRIRSLDRKLTAWQQAGGVDSPEQLEAMIKKWQVAAGKVSPELLQSRIAALEASAARDPERIDRVRFQQLMLLESKVQVYLEALNELAECLPREGIAPDTEESSSETIPDKLKKFFSNRGGRDE